MADDNRGKWKTMAENARARLAGITERQKETASVAINSALALGGNALMGFLHGRKGGIPVTFGIPWDMGGGTLLGIAGLWGVSRGSMWGAPLAAFGSGVGGYWVGSTFAAIGRRKREEAGDWVDHPLTAKEAQDMGVKYLPPVTAGRFAPNARGYAPAYYGR